MPLKLTYSIHRRDFMYRFLRFLYKRGYICIRFLNFYTYETLDCLRITIQS